MKKFSLTILLLILLSGCYSSLNHFYSPNSITKCYEATSWCWNHCIVTPFNEQVQVNDPILSSIVIVTYPYWIIDECGEIILDTVFLPWDIYRSIVSEK